MSWIGGWAVGFFARSRRRRESSKRSSSSKPTITKREKIIPSVAYFAINKDISVEDIVTIIEHAVKHSYAHEYENLEVIYHEGKYLTVNLTHFEKAKREYPSYKKEEAYIMTIHAKEYSDYDILYLDISSRAFSQVTELVFLDYFDRYIEPILYDPKVATKEDETQ